MSDVEKKKTESSLRFSFLDGIFANGMIGFTENYFTPFALLLGATVRQIGLLSSLPNLASALIQLVSPDLTAHVKSRKKIITSFVYMQACILLPMVAIALWGKRTSPFLFIIYVTLFTAIGSFAMPAWGSLMSDLVGAHRRGEYFGWRNKILGLLMVTSSLAAGLVLHYMRLSSVFLGFAIIFGCAFVFRIFSWYFLTKMYEPHLEHKKEDHFTLVRFLARIKQSNFAKFVLFVSTMNFCVNIASPFFSVFMLRDLHFSYLLYTVITITAAGTVYLMMSRWGRHADIIGNLKVVKVTAPIIAVLPLFWIVNRAPWYLIFAQIVSGFAWAGFNLCAANFVFDAVVPAKRTRCIAYFSALNGLGLCLGALTGGFLVEHMPRLFGYKLLALFLFSSCLRLIVAIVGPFYLKEVRAVPHVTSRRLMTSVMGIKPILT